MAWNLPLQAVCRRDLHRIDPNPASGLNSSYCVSTDLLQKGSCLSVSDSKARSVSGVSKARLAAPPCGSSVDASVVVGASHQCCANGPAIACDGEAYPLEPAGVSEALDSSLGTYFCPGD
jgi:hypothetical protein